MAHIWPIYGHLWPYMVHMWSIYGHIWSIDGHIWRIYGPYVDHHIRMKWLFICFLTKPRFPLFGPPWPSPGLPGLQFNSIDLVTGKNMVTTGAQVPAANIGFILAIYDIIYGRLWSCIWPYMAIYNTINGPKYPKSPAGTLANLSKICRNRYLNWWAGTCG